MLSISLSLTAVTVHQICTRLLLCEEFKHVLKCDTMNWDNFCYNFWANYSRWWIHECQQIPGNMNPDWTFQWIYALNLFVVQLCVTIPRKNMMSWSYRAHSTERKCSFVVLWIISFTLAHSWEYMSSYEWKCEYRYEHTSANLRIKTRKNAV